MVDAQERTLPGIAKDRSTRMLVAGVLADQDLGRYVHGELCVPTLRVVAPSPGIDLVVVARYAAWAMRVRLKRELGLAAALLAIVALVTGLVPLAIESMVQAVLFLLGAAWLWRTARNYQLVVSAASVLRSSEPIDPGPGLLDAGREARLARQNTANLSIYSARRSDPFPGLGTNVGSKVMSPVNIAVPNSPTNEIKPFDAADLHEYLVTAVPRLGFDDIDARNVVHVAGGWVRRVDGLLPLADSSPVVEAPEGLVEQVANDPREELRTYMRAQMVRHGGSLVTTVNVRVRIVGEVLSWDVVWHLLGPINDASYLTAATLGLTSTSRLRTAMRLSSRHIFLDMVESPLEAMKCLFSVSAERRRPLLAALRKSERRDPYGAVDGEREYAGYGAELNTHQELDAKDQFQRLFTAIYRAVVAFLEDHNVDVSDLVENQYETINNTVNNVFGDVKQAVFAPNSSATMNNNNGPRSEASSGKPRQ